jgi:alkylation response protein AidB-like acyl-CoA dehydrogenase
MDESLTGDDECFRGAIRDWLEENLSGRFAEARGLGGPGREHEAFELRRAWDQHMAASGWTCIGWPVQYGGRGAALEQQVAFHEEYARAQAPVRISHIGEELLGPTLIAFGTDEQRERFLPSIVSVQELWCQGYSEPGAGSDLANVSTRAVLDGEQWVIDGQKVWTSNAEWADWCFVIARTDRRAERHRGLSCLLVPMRQPGVEIRPIVQLTGTSEFSEVFFTEAKTDRDNVVGAVDDGWSVAMGTLGFERGVATLGQQVGFRTELQGLIALAQRTSAIEDALIRDKLTRAWIGLEVMRFNALRTLAGVAAGTPGPEASISKLFWARWHRALGELAMEIQGAASMVADGRPYDLNDWQRLFLYTRADTIYAGSDEIQRNIIAERVLGLPREPRA